MKMNRLAGRVTAVAGSLILLSAQGPTRAQGSQPAAAQPPRIGSAAPGPMRDPRGTDDFAGLKFSDEQKAKIDEIHQRLAVRKDVVIKSEKLNRDQKDAMIAGLGRMERGEIVKVLTPEQQKEVLKKAHAGQGAAQDEKKPSPPR
jgi:Spy/CpxP family protein refolding chaperone